MFHFILIISYFFQTILFKIRSIWTIINKIGPEILYRHMTAPAQQLELELNRRASKQLQLTWTDPVTSSSSRERELVYQLEQGCPGHVLLKTRTRKLRDVTRRLKDVDSSRSFKKILSLLIEKSDVFRLNFHLLITSGSTRRCSGYHYAENPTCQKTT
jgi:hypothetical protein